MSTINVDMNNVTSDGRLRVAAGRLPEHLVLERGVGVLLHDRIEEVVLTGTVDNITDASIFSELTGRARRRR